MNPTDSHLLCSALEDVVVFVRRLPLDPAMSFNAASVLRACAVGGPQRISALSRQLGVTQPAVTQLIDRMAAEGLVARIAEPSDRRVVLVRATAAGQTYFTARREMRAELLDALLAHLDPDDQDALRAATPALARLTLLVP